MPDQKRSESGQGLVEYALIVTLIALVAFLAMSAMGERTQGAFSRVLQSGGESGILGIKDDMLARIQDFYNRNGRWPRSWGDYAYTDIGLDPDDWDEAVEGIYWGPHGSNIGLANRHDDNLQVYVKDLEGNTLHLYDGWSIWCPVGDEHCYYHTIAPGNEVDLSTLVIVEE